MIRVISLQTFKFWLATWQNVFTLYIVNCIITRRNNRLLSSGFVLLLQYTKLLSRPKIYWFNYKTCFIFSAKDWRHDFLISVSIFWIWLDYEPSTPRPMKDVDVMENYLVTHSCVIGMGRVMTYNRVMPRHVATPLKRGGAYAWRHLSINAFKPTHL